MLFTTEVFKDLLGTIAIMALLAVAYGTIMRTSVNAWLGQSLMGALFGGAAIMSMHDSIHIAEGVIGDLRSVPIVLAGAFLGPRGAAITVVLALIGRIETGGAGTASGCLGIVIGGMVGLGWAWRLRERQPGLPAILGLAALSSSTVLSVALMPSGAIGTFLFKVWPLLLPLQVLGIIIVGTVLERERRLFGSEQRLTQAAEEDPLTGLLNRRGFDSMIPQMSMSGKSAGLLLIDLDHFKRVNDLHGHAAGDAVLKEVGLRLKRSSRPNDLVSRFGGEEMVIFLPGLTARQTKEVGQRICNLIGKQPFLLPSRSILKVTVSVGGTWTAGPVDFTTLLDQADGALYDAKAAGRDRCRFAAAADHEGAVSPDAGSGKTGALPPASGLSAA